MNISQGFHAKYPTSISSEIELAANLHTAAGLRWGMWKLPKMLRTDPAAVLGKMAYCRFQFKGEGGWQCASSIPHEEHTRATNAEILTPSHPEWMEFQERLDAHLLCDDFNDYFGASQIVTHDSIYSEYWPLCSASIVAGLGFAVAETLCVFASFLGDTDQRIAEHVASMWRNTKPSKIRPAFDRDPLQNLLAENPADKQSP
jgi:hypothetical protein